MPFTGISLNLTLRGDILLETPHKWRRPRYLGGPHDQDHTVFICELP
jgi:hypothetical protein